MKFNSSKNISFKMFDIFHFIIPLIKRFIYFIWVFCFHRHLVGSNRGELASIAIYTCNVQTNPKPYLRKVTNFLAKTKKKAGIEGGLRYRSWVRYWNPIAVLLIATYCLYEYVYHTFSSLNYLKKVCMNFQLWNTLLVYVFS